MARYSFKRAETTIAELNEAKRPLILAGNGIRQANAVKSFNKFLWKTYCPALTTWRAADIIDCEYPLHFGRPGMIGQRAANRILQECDYLLCLGARLDLAQVAFNYDNFAPKAKKVVVDIDEAELDKLPSDYEKVCLPADFFIERLLDNCMDCLTVNEWSAYCEDLKNKYKDVFLDETDPTSSLYHFVYHLSKLCADRTIVLGSSGTIAEVFFQAAEMQPGMRVINTPGLGSMGFALPAAIGAYYATGKPIICIDGDGSFAMNMQELCIIARKNLPITMFVINNNGYVSIRNTQDNLCEGRKIGSNEASGLELPNYMAIADAFCLRNKLVFNYAKFNDIILDDAPYLYDVCVDLNHKTICRTKTIKDENGNLRATGLEEV